jgi:CDP-diacylglycerol--serine O-phosphatidyltransferase
VLAANHAAVHSGPGHDELVHITRDLLQHPIALSATALALSVLMLSEIPLPSLKFKHFGWKGNEVIHLLLGIGLVLVVLYGVLAVPLILVIYLLSPFWGRLFPQAH